MTRVLLTGAAMAAVLTGLALMANGKDEDAKPRTIASGLDNPSGLALHSSGDVFIAAHTGIHRLHGGKVSTEIAGFKTDIYGKGPKYNIGPLGVAFLDDSHLVVGDGSNPDGAELALVYKVGAKPAEKPAGADSAESKLGPLGPGATPLTGDAKAPPATASDKGEGNFYGVAVTKDAAFFTSNGDDTKGWILRADHKDGKLSNLKPFIATKPLVNVDAPVAITLDPDGKHLIVGQMGEVNMAGDSLLCKYSLDGKLVSSAKTGLSDIAALAFSPKTGKLYAVDFSWVDTKKGGLFLLETSGDGVKATKIADLDKPTALAFDKEGGLFVTVFGTAEGDKPAGALLRFAPGL